MSLFEVHYDSSRVAPADQLRCWQEAAASVFYAAERRPLPSASGLPGRLASRRCASLRVLHVLYPAMQADRQPQRRESASGCLYMALLKSGSASMSSGTATLRHREGDIALWDGDGHDVWVFHEPIDALCVRIPKSVLRSPQLLPGRGLVLGRESWMRESVASLVQSAASMPVAVPESAAFRLQESLLNAALAAWQSEARAPRGSRLQMAQDYIDARLADTDLQPAQVAAAIHVSERTLLRVFAAAGTTPAAWIWNRRLETAHRLLQDGERPVTEVALNCGFKSLAHFSHAFKSHYQLSPTALARGRG